MTTDTYKSKVELVGDTVKQNSQSMDFDNGTTTVELESESTTLGDSFINNNHKLTANKSKKKKKSKKDGENWEVKFEKEKSPIPSIIKMTNGQRLLYFGELLFNTTVILACLYFFIISLDLLGSGFQILSGTTVGQTMRNSTVFNNPIAGLMIGILVTVLVQSSSTSTSIFVSMAASGLLTLDQVVYMIMGANIGTSVTNTIVSMTQIANTNMFRRAFAGATVHDMFNFLTVAIFLPIEVASGFLVFLAEKSTESLGDADVSNDMDFIKVITKPLTSQIISVNKTLINEIGKANDTEIDELLKYSMVNWDKCPKPDKWFVYCPNSNWSDPAVGATLLLWSLVMLIVCLMILVAVLQSIMKGRVSVWLHKCINADIPYPFGWLKGYLLMIVGMGITILVQSSSVTTSTLVPLIGIGVLNLETMYPVCLGANIGTTFTSVISAFSQDNKQIALAVAFTHLYFNIFGICVWYPVPFMRQVPIGMARTFGNITARHRWFALFYVITGFFLMPAALFALSLAGWYVLLGVCLPFIVLIIVLVVIFQLRKRRPQWLPPYLLEFYWLPIWLRREPLFLSRLHERLELKAEKQEKKEALEKAKGKLSPNEKLYKVCGPLDEEVLAKRRGELKTELKEEDKLELSSSEPPSEPHSNVPSFNNDDKDREAADKKLDEINLNDDSSDEISENSDIINNSV